MVLPTAPRLASWNKATDPDQIALRDYLADTVKQTTSSIPTTGPWALWLDVGLPANRALLSAADLDNYALPPASAVPNERLVAVWCSKRHAASSHLVIAPAHRTSPPAGTIQVRTTASTATTGYKQQVRDAVIDMPELADGPVRLQVAFAVGPSRNWLNLWKPTIDALDPILGCSHPNRDWNPRDGRVVDLGLHLKVDTDLGFDVELSIAVEEGA